MSIESRRRAPRTALCGMAVLLHVAFAVLGALPQVVFCHRSGGGVVVEFASPDGVCMCVECEHCLERLGAARSGTEPRGASMEACHCRHERSLLDAAQSSCLREKERPGFEPELASAASPAALPELLRAWPAPASSTALSPPAFPGGSALLRC